MYETFYQLSADPFRLSPDPAFCFPHRTYRKAMTYMLHALHRAEGFIMITGRPGTGKTTLINDLIQTLKADQVVVSKIVSTQLTADDLLNLVAYSFNLDPEGGGKAKVLIQVERFLKQQYQHGRRPLLIVDEAQDMGDDALEELRLLTNIQLGNHQLLQVFLVGQEQLRTTVNTPSLEQLHQRLIAATLLEPLDTDDTKAYIKHRLRRVNWKGNPLLSTETYAIMQRYSQGIPRRINQICSRLFLHGCIEEKHRLGLADLKIVVEELQQELLLPTDKAGLNQAVPWPAESQEETYEEEPQTSPPTSETLLPSTHTLPETETPGQKPSTMAADTPLYREARKPVSDAGPRSVNILGHEKPTASKRTQWLSPWRLTALSGLLAGILLAFIYTKHTQVTRLTDQNLITSMPPGGQKTSSIVTRDFSQQTSKADEDMRRGKVVRKSSPLNHGPKSNVSEYKTRLHESEPELVQARGQGGIP
ncbi:MAG: AAA family ATPase, partial [Thiogranum sp.]